MRVAIALALSLFAVTASAQHIPVPGDDKPTNHPGCRFNATSVVAPRGTPGATIYFAGVTRVTAFYASEVDQPAGMSVADSTGQATFTATPPDVGIWLTVDGSTADYSIGSRAIHLLRESDLPANALQTDPTTNELRRVALARMHVAVTLVRPGSGMWTGAFMDGDSDADNTQNGTTVADIASLTPVGSSPAAPTSLQPNDILFAVDPVTFEYFVSKRP